MSSKFANNQNRLPTKNQNAAIKPARSKTHLFFGLLLVCFVFSIATGCGFNKPTLAFKTVKLHEADFEGVTLDVVYTLKNPNPISLKLASIAYKLEVEERPIVSGQPPNGLSVAAHGNSELVFPARIRFQDVAPTVSVFLTRDQAKYRASGEVGIGTPIGVLKLPMSYSGTFQVPKLPLFELQNPRIQGLSLRGARVIVPVKITNKNPFSLPVSGFSAHISIGGANIGSASGALPSALGAGESRVVDMAVDADFSKTGMALANALNGRSAHVKLEGELKSHGTTIPINLAQNLSLR